MHGAYNARILSGGAVVGGNDIRDGRVSGDARAPLDPFRFMVLNLTLGVGHFLVLFNTGAYLPMIPYAAGALGRAISYGDWTQANFFIAMAAGFPIAPRFAGRFGEVHTLVGAFVVFALASAVCASTHGFWVFLLARGAQGFAGGVTVPVSLRGLLRHYRPDRRNLGLVLWGVAALMPFTLGPTLGGILIEELGFRALFILNVPIALAVAALSTVVLFHRESGLQSQPMDWRGLILLLGTLACGLWAVDLAEVRDFWRSPIVETLGLASLVALGLLVAWERGRKEPLVDVRLFARWNFTVGALGLFLTGLLFQGLMAIFVIQYEVAMGYGPLWVGLLILPMAIFSKLASILTHRWMTRIDPRLIGMFALVGMGASCAFAASYDRNASFDALLWPQVVAGIFVGGLFPPFAAIGLSGLAGSAELKASGVLNLLRVSGQAFGIPVFATLWEVRDIVHRHFVVEADAAARAHISQLQAALAAHGLRPSVAHAILARSLGRAAGELAMGEVFYIAMWGFFALAGLCLLARPVIFAESDKSVRLAAQELVEP